MAYQFDPDLAPDADFEAGKLHHIVVGSDGRLLDARRTPVRIVGIRPELALFEVEVLAFEDRGARWELFLDTVDRFQFRRGAPTANQATVRDYRAAVRRFAEPIHIAVDEARLTESQQRLTVTRGHAAAWFADRSSWAQHDRTIDVTAPSGDRRLFDDVAAFLEDRGVADLEQELTRSYVSNPNAGEAVRGHAIVAAELGLASYRGPAVRDQASWQGRWTRERRAEHLIARLAFVSTVFALAGRPTVDLHRGMSFEHSFVWRPSDTFVSATFDRAIAEEQATLGPHRSMTMLVSQRVPVERLWMTYHETSAMNGPFQEAEAVVLSSHTHVF